MSERRRTWRPRPASGVRPTPSTLPPGPTGAGTESDPTGSPGVGARQVLMLIGLINTGGLDGYLPAIRAAIGERHQHRHRAQSNQAAARIEVGDRVRLGHDIRPPYLHGATGTVTGGAGQNVVVQPDEPNGRDATGQIRCPPLGPQPSPT